MLFTYTESSIVTTLEDVEAGMLDENEAVGLLVKDEEILQEMKSRNPDLLQFLSKETSVTKMLDFVNDEPNALEILLHGDDDMTIHVAKEARRVFENAGDSKWDQLLEMLGHRHRATLESYVTPEIFRQLLPSRAVCHLFGKKPLLLPDLDVSDVLEYPEIAVDLIKIPERIIQTDALNRFVQSISEDDLAARVKVLDALIEARDLLHDDSFQLLTELLTIEEYLGEGRVAIARFVRSCLRKQKEVPVEVVRRLVNLMFNHDAHSIYHRIVTDVILDSLNTNLLPFVLGEVLPRVETTFVALLPTKTSSLRAHLGIVAEAIANALYRDLLVGPGSENDAFKCTLENTHTSTTAVAVYFNDHPTELHRFLTFVDMDLIPFTLKRTVVDDDALPLEQDDIVPRLLAPGLLLV